MTATDDRPSAKAQHETKLYRFSHWLRCLGNLMLGHTSIYLQQRDRDLYGVDLPDDVFLPWARWACDRVADTFQQAADQDGRDVKEVIAMHVTTSLIRAMRVNSAIKMTSTVEGVSVCGEDWGDWRVTIEKLPITGETHDR